MDGIQTKSDTMTPISAGISVLHCDILDSEELAKLNQTLQDTFNGIDIVIDNATNEVFSDVKNDDCQEFIDGTSEKLRTTINVNEIQVIN